MNALEIFVILFFVIFILGTFFIYFNPDAIGEKDISFKKAIIASGVLLIFGIICIVISTVIHEEENQV